MKVEKYKKKKGLKFNYKENQSNNNRDGNQT